MEKNGGGQVVGNVAHDPEPPRPFSFFSKPLPEGREIHLEDVRLENVHVSQGFQFFSQDLRQPGIHLYGHDPGSPGGETLRQETQAGTDFHHRPPFFGNGKIADFPDHVPVDEKGLAKTLEGPDAVFSQPFQRRHGCSCFRTIRRLRRARA